MNAKEEAAFESIQDSLETIFKNSRVELRHINKVEDVIEKLNNLVEGGKDF